MSFIVKGIDLPKNKDCVNLSIYSNGDVYEQVESGFYFETNSYAIQIPKDHGKIGDLDIAIKNIEESISYADNELKEYKVAENKDDYVDNYDIKIINEMAGLISAQVDVSLTPIILEKEDKNG